MNKLQIESIKRGKYVQKAVRDLTDLNVEVNVEYYSNGKNRTTIYTWDGEKMKYYVNVYENAKVPTFKQLAQEFRKVILDSQANERQIASTSSKSAE